MKHFRMLLLMAIAASPVMGQGAVIFSEGFETPALAPGGFLEIDSSAAQTFDNPDWTVVNVTSGATQGAGVYVDNNFLFTPFSSLQVLGFGGGDSPTGSEVYREIGGFTGMTLPTISYDHLVIGAIQGVRVEVTDPNNSDAVLYTADHYDTAQISDVAIAAPAGDSVVLTLSQIGTTENSDSAVDNIEINAVPEPTAALLALIGLAGISMRRRRVS